MVCFPLLCGGTHRTRVSVLSKGCFALFARKVRTSRISGVSSVDNIRCLWLNRTIVYERGHVVRIVEAIGVGLVTAWLGIVVVFGLLVLREWWSER